MKKVWTPGRWTLVDRKKNDIDMLTGLFYIFFATEEILMDFHEVKGLPAG